MRSDMQFDRNEDIYQMVAVAGMTLRSVAEIYDLSRQRIFKIVKTHAKIRGGRKNANKKL